MGSFFILNLFIGVIIDNFNRLKQQVSFVFCSLKIDGWVTDPPTHWVAAPLTDWQKELCVADFLKEIVSVDIHENRTVPVYDEYYWIETSPGSIFLCPTPLSSFSTANKLAKGEIRGSCRDCRRHPSSVSRFSGSRPKTPGAFLEAAGSRLRSCVNGTSWMKHLVLNDGKIRTENNRKSTHVSRIF